MRFIIFGLLSILLSACATPQLPITKESHERAAQLQQHNKGLTSWDITASTSLSTEESSYALTLYWHQHKDQYNLRFDAPFTTGVLKVKGQKGYSEIIVDNKKTLKGVKPEDLIAEVTKFNIPVTGLTQWIRGIPHQNSEYQLAIKANGETKTIKQDGWLIEFEDWEKFNIGQQVYRLPKQVNLSQENLNIQINANNWVKPKAVKSNPLFSDLDF